MTIIHSILFFILGIVVSGLFFLLLLPVLWRRARVLSYREIKQKLPLSLEEIAIKCDFLRVQHAADLAIIEEKLRLEQSEHRDCLMRFSETEEKLSFAAPFESLCAELKTKLAKNELKLAAMQKRLDKRKLKIEELLAVKQDYILQAKEMKQQQQQLQKLEEEHQQLKEQLEGAVIISSRTASQFRDEIQLIAAYIAASIAKKEGTSSPIVQLLNQADLSEGGLAASIGALFKQQKL